MGGTKIMKVLILEDDPIRIKIFDKKLKGHDLYFFTEVADAIEAVKNFGPFDYYFLDHDLGGEIYVDSNKENTGYQFAKFLAESKATGKMYIHSMNGVGAQNMKAVLPEAVIVPFPYLFS